MQVFSVPPFQFNWYFPCFMRYPIGVKMPNRLLIVFLLVLGVTYAPGAIRPNILFVFIDDNGWADLSCYGSTVTNKLGQPITPNLDKLASEGIRFTQGYVASPICSPSRTGVLTGMDPCRF